MAVDSLARALRGRPGMRREIAGLGKARADALGEAILARGRDPIRDREFIRRDLQQMLGHERDARPIDNRMLIENTLADPSKITSSQRDQLVDTLRRDKAGWGTVAHQRSPYRWGSIAQQQFGSLYRR